VGRVWKKENGKVTTTGNLMVAKVKRDRILQESAKEHETIKEKKTMTIREERGGIGTAVGKKGLLGNPNCHIQVWGPLGGKWRELVTQGKNSIRQKGGQKPKCRERRNS